MKTVKDRQTTIASLVLFMAVLVSGCGAQYTVFLKQTNKTLKKTIRARYIRGLTALEKYENRPSDLTKSDIDNFDALTATIARVVSSGKPEKETK